MHRNAASKLLRRGTQIRPSCQRLLSQSTRIPRTASRSIRIATPSSIHLFSTTSASYKAISPDPTPREPAADNSASPADLSIEEYHQLSEDYMDSIVGKLEELQEDREDVDVEYSAGVLTLTFPPNGTYVINKQPPNKQIWLSSPISGPKRYDYAVVGEGQNAKGGTGAGNWVYLRDMSTLRELLLKEVGVDVDEL